jgi:hypothetical protein
MKKILIFLLIGFIIPQVTFAAWWNPRTWFVPRDTKNLHLEEVIKNDELVPSKEQSAVSTSSLGTSETKIVERVVTKTIPVDRVVEKIVIQSDQSVIDENNLLKIKIKELQAISNQCVVDTEGLQARIKQLEAPLTQAEAQRKATLTSIANMDLEIMKTKAGYYDSSLPGGRRCRG